MAGAPIRPPGGPVPPTFGALSRSAYGSSNLLIGQPLAYQYLQSIRPDAIPATVDDLLRMRGRGWVSSFPSATRPPGRPAHRQHRAVGTPACRSTVSCGMIEWTGSVTVGSLSDPLVRDNNGGRQLAGRIVVRADARLHASAFPRRTARGSTARSTRHYQRGSRRTTRQAAIGVDTEFSSGAFLIRAEVIRSTWTLPAVADAGHHGPLVDHLETARRPLQDPSRSLGGAQRAIGSTSTRSWAAPGRPDGTPPPGASKRDRRGRSRET